jgi:adenylate kinase family enzyme
MCTKNYQVGREPDVVVFFDCPEDEMVKRLLGRNQVSLHASLLNSRLIFTQSKHDFPTV